MWNLAKCSRFHALYFQIIQRKDLFPINFSLKHYQVWLCHELCTTVMCVTMMSYYSNVTTVMILCMLFTEADINTIKAKISKKKIKKQFIEVEVMSPSTSVVISDIIDSKRNIDYLSLYFTNPKHSGVSEYDNIEVLDDGRVIVHLQDQKGKDDHG